MSQPAGESIDLRTIPHVVEAARRRLEPDVWDYSCGGADSETTLRRNRLAFAGLAFRPRVMRGVVQPSTTATLLGHPLSLPVALAPVGSISAFHDDGALACARTAGEVGTAAFVGILSEPALEDVRAGSDGPLVFQIYLYGDRAWLESLVSRVEAAGYQAICLTVDVAAYGRRERDIHNGFHPRRTVERPNLGAASIVLGLVDDDARNSAATWGDVRWLRTVTSLPIMVKGVMTGEDARIAVEHGVDVVYVSNHGGRQLDHLPSTIEILPEVVAAVGGRAEIILDSGIMRGSDVLKALALGASVVTIGKLMAWGLAAGGEAGLRRVLELLRIELVTAMTNLGISSFDELDPSMLHAVSAAAGSVWPANE